MGWQVVGRAGVVGRSWAQRKRAFDERFGPGGWRLRHLVCGQLLDLAAAARHCEESCVLFFTRNPQLLDWLCGTARDVYATAASNVRSGLDYTVQERKSEHIQDIAIRRALGRLGRSFTGERLLHIGNKGDEGRRFSSGQVPFYQPGWIMQPALCGWWQPDSVECFWQSNRVVEAWLPDEPAADSARWEHG
jgi:hypothetical protein